MLGQGGKSGGAYGQAGQPEAGLQVLAKAVTLVAATEERWWEAELYRLQGELLRQLLGPDVCQAKALELRAAMSLI